MDDDLMLTSDEGARLTDLEASIDRNVHAFIAVGEALVAIRNERLYRQTHGTFEAYVAERWGWTRQHAYRYITAATVQSTVGENWPLPSERHARLLTAFTPDMQREIAPQIIGLTAAKAAKIVQDYRRVETLTTPATEKARSEIREALSSEDPIAFYADWCRASDVLMARMGELPHDEMVDFTRRFIALRDRYEVVRAERER